VESFCFATFAVFSLLVAFAWGTVTKRTRPVTKEFCLRIVSKLFLYKNIA
jgi:hypothetical protein